MFFPHLCFICGRESFPDEDASARRRRQPEAAPPWKNWKTSTVQIRKLQSGLQTVCAWTKQIKVGEKWMTPEEFLRSQLHLDLTHGISPQAFREMAQDTEKSG